MKFFVFAGIFLSGAAAFGPSTAFTKKIPRSALFYYPDRFEKAVNCAEHYGQCDLEEMEKLADELEEFQGCFFEKGKETCEKEILDRMDVADILRLQCELRLRTDYLKNANLFDEDVKEERFKHEREIFEAFQSW